VPHLVPVLGNGADFDFAFSGSFRVRLATVGSSTTELAIDRISVWCYHELCLFALPSADPVSPTPTVSYTVLLVPPHEGWRVPDLQTLLTPFLSYRLQTPTPQTLSYHIVTKIMGGGGLSPFDAHFASRMVLRETQMRSLHPEWN
jgi:hypothetical protein